MTLKSKKLSTESATPASDQDQWSGPWGRINPAPGASVVRFSLIECGRIRKIYSFPYRVLSSWCWTDNPDHEEIKIQCSGHIVTIRGKMLERIVRALDDGALDLISESPAATTAFQEATMIQISSVVVETSDLTSLRGPIR